jgi:hypothetical protein
MEFTDLLYPCAEVSKKLDNWNFLLSCNMKRSVADRRPSPGMWRSMLSSCHYYVHQACTTFSNTSNYHRLRFRTSDLLRVEVAHWFRNLRFILSMYTSDRWAIRQSIFLLHCADHGRKSSKVRDEVCYLVAIQTSSTTFSNSLWSADGRRSQGSWQSTLYLFHFRRQAQYSSTICDLQMEEDLKVSDKSNYLVPFQTSCKKFSNQWTSTLGILVCTFDWLQRGCRVPDLKILC